MSQSIDTASTKTLDFKSLYLDQFRGHCIPIDPYYLSWIAKKDMSLKC